jgi:hypothetical protein
MGPLSAVRKGVRPTQHPYLSPAGRPSACRGSLCSAGFPWEAECDGFAGEPAGRPPAQPPPWESRPRVWARPHRSSASQTTPKPQHPIQATRDKGCLIMPTTWRHINWCNDASPSSSSQKVYTVDVMRRIVLLCDGVRLLQHFCDER